MQALLKKRQIYCLLVYKNISRDILYMSHDIVFQKTIDLLSLFQCKILPVISAFHKFLELYETKLGDVYSETEYTEFVSEYSIFTRDHRADLIEYSFARNATVLFIIRQHMDQELLQIIEEYDAPRMSIGGAVKNNAFILDIFPGTKDKIALRLLIRFYLAHFPINFELCQTSISHNKTYLAQKINGINLYL